MALLSSLPRHRRYHIFFSYEYFHELSEDILCLRITASKSDPCEICINWNVIIIVLFFFLSLSCVWLCNPMNCSPPGSSVHGISQAGTLEWVAISFSRGSSPPRDQPTSPALAGWLLTPEPPGKPQLKTGFILFSCFHKDSEISYRLGLCPKHRKGGLWERTAVVTLRY